MDIHRCRFVEFQPSAINALAFTHSSGRGSRNQPLRLAIGRANGDIEIWNPLQGAWLHEVTFRGGRDRSVEGLAWIQDPDEKNETTGFISNGRLRLFSIGYSSAVTEWDLLTGLPLRHSSGTHSEVWCLAAQPKIRLDTKNKSAIGLSQDLVVGCADGSLVLLSTRDSTLAFQKFIFRASKKNARALSLAFQTRETLVAGFADSSIRVFNVDKSTLLRTISLGPGPRTGPKEKLVWALECLKDGTIVSADSSGEVRFWDGNMYSQQQRIQAHEADALCLASSEDGKTVMSAGVDRRTIVYSLSAIDGQKPKWAKSAQNRYHKHDVKAAASFENQKMSLVVSGGLDTAPMLVPLREHGREYHRALPYTPQEPPVTSCGRHIVNWNNNTLTIWKIQERNQMVLATDDDPRPNYKPVVRIALKGDENVTSTTISPSGKLLAVSSSAETKLFYLTPRSNGSLRIRKLDASPSTGCRILQFSPDSKWLLAVSTSNQISIFRVILEADTKDSAILSRPTVLHRISRSKATQNSMNGHWGSYDRKITRVAFSSDSRILAISDLAGYVDTFVLTATGNQSNNSSADSSDVSDSDESMDSDSSSSSNDDNSAHDQRWLRNSAGKSIPRLPSAPIVLSFRPSPDASQGQRPSTPSEHEHIPNGHPPSTESLPSDHLFIITAKHEIYELAVLEGTLTDWSRRNPTSALPESFKLQRDRAMGCIWDTSNVRPSANSSSNQSRRNARLWVYGSAWLCMFDLSQDLQSHDSQSTDHYSSQNEPDGPKTNGVVAKPSEPEVSRKRKRSQLQATNAAVLQSLALKKNTTGAGSKVQDHELGGGLGSRTIRKIDEDGNVSFVNLDAASQAQRAMRSSSDDEDSAEEEEALENLRQLRQQEANGDAVQVNGYAEHATKAAFYLTNKYRTILGIVPIEKEDGGAEGIEVALIERPFWDLELPPRFIGARDSR